MRFVMETAAKPGEFPAYIFSIFYVFARDFFLFHKKSKICVDNLFFRLKNAVLLEKFML